MNEFRVTRDVDAPADAVLTALVKETREWRESAIPPHLRREGVLRVVGELADSHFEWRFFGGEPKTGTVRLVGTVYQRDGRATVKARVIRAAPSWPPIALFAAFAVINLVNREFTGAFWLFGFSAFFCFIAWARDGTIPDWTGSRARYLIERLYHAIDAAQSSSAPPSTRPANER